MNQVIGYGAPGPHSVEPLLKGLLIRVSGDPQFQADLLESGAVCGGHPEEPVRVQRAGGIDFQFLNREAHFCGDEVGHYVHAADQTGQYILDWIGATIIASQRRRFIDDHRKIPGVDGNARG